MQESIQRLLTVCKMLIEQLILDRFKCLAANVKSRLERIVIVIKEAKILWKKLNFPIQQGKSTVERKTVNVQKKYEKDSSNPGTQDFTNLFNLTDEKGEWLCQEDRDFYNLQMSTNGRAGYCTTIKDTQRVHPRKLKFIKEKVSQDTIEEYEELKVSFYDSGDALKEVEKILWRNGFPLSLDYLLQVD